MLQSPKLFAGKRYFKIRDNSFVVANVAASIGYYLDQRLFLIEFSRTMMYLYVDTEFSLLVFDWRYTFLKNKQHFGVNKINCPISVNGFPFG